MPRRNPPRVGHNYLNVTHIRASMGLDRPPVQRRAARKRPPIIRLRQGLVDVLGVEK